MLLEFDGHQQKSSSVAGFHGFATSRTPDGWGERAVFTLACKMLIIAADSVTVCDLNVGLHPHGKWLQRGIRGEPRNSHAVLQLQDDVCCLRSVSGRRSSASPGRCRGHSAICRVCATVPALPRLAQRQAQQRTLTYVLAHTCSPSPAPR